MKDIKLTKKDVFVVIGILIIVGIIEWLKTEGMFPLYIPTTVISVILLFWYFADRLKKKS